jgi:hypothetical protein
MASVAIARGTPSRELDLIGEGAFFWLSLLCTGKENQIGREAHETLLTLPHLQEEE